MRLLKNAVRELFFPQPARPATFAVPQGYQPDYPKPDITWAAPIPEKPGAQPKHEWKTDVLPFPAPLDMPTRIENAREFLKSQGYDTIKSDRIKTVAKSVVLMKDEFFESEDPVICARTIEMRKRRLKMEVGMNAAELATQTRDFPIVSDKDAACFSVTMRVILPHEAPDPTT